MEGGGRGRRAGVARPAPPPPPSSHHQPRELGVGAHVNCEQPLGARELYARQLTFHRHGTDDPRAEATEPLVRSEELLECNIFLRRQRLAQRRELGEKGGRRAWEARKRGNALPRWRRWWQVSAGGRKGGARRPRQGAAAPAVRAALADVCEVFVRRPRGALPRPRTPAWPQTPDSAKMWSPGGARGARLAPAWALRAAASRAPAPIRHAARIARAAAPAMDVGRNAATHIVPGGAAGRRRATPTHRPDRGDVFGDRFRVLEHPTAFAHLGGRGQAAPRAANSCPLGGGGLALGLAVVLGRDGHGGSGAVVGGRGLRWRE